MLDSKRADRNGRKGDKWRSNRAMKPHVVVNHFQILFLFYTPEDSFLLGKLVTDLCVHLGSAARKLCLLVSNYLK